MNSSLQIPVSCKKCLRVRVCGRVLALWAGVTARLILALWTVAAVTSDEEELALRWIEFFLQCPGVFFFLALWAMPPQDRRHSVLTINFCY